eukprot:6643116-Ditylum_brightwellii.AAC.1
MRQGLEWGKRSKLYVFTSHGANCTKLDVQLWHRDSTISRDQKWGARSKLYVLSSHRTTQHAKLDMQQWHRDLTISRDWTGKGQ